MTTTTAKLRELLEGEYVQLCHCGFDDLRRHEESCADAVRLKALARLVVTLTEALEDAYHFLPEHPHAAGHACADVCAARDKAKTALDAFVEDLEL